MTRNQSIKHIKYSTVMFQVVWYLCYLNVADDWGPLFNALRQVSTDDLCMK